MAPAPMTSARSGAEDYTDSPAYSEYSRLMKQGD